MNTTPETEAVAIEIPGKNLVRTITVTRSGSKQPLSHDEELMLHMHAELRRLDAIETESKELADKVVSLTRKLQEKEEEHASLIAMIDSLKSRIDWYQSPTKGKLPVGYISPRFDIEGTYEFETYDDHGTSSRRGWSPVWGKQPQEDEYEVWRWIAVCVIRSSPSTIVHASRTVESKEDADLIVGQWKKLGWNLDLFAIEAKPLYRKKESDGLQGPGDSRPETGAEASGK